MEVYEKKIKLLEKQRKDVSLLFLLLIPFVPLREKLVVVFFPSLTCFTACYRYWRWTNSGTFSGTPWSHSLNRRYSNDSFIVMESVGRCCVLGWFRVAEWELLLPISLCQNSLNLLKIFFFKLFCFHFDAQTSSVCLHQCVQWTTTCRNTNNRTGEFRSENKQEQRSLISHQRALECIVMHVKTCDRSALCPINNHIFSRFSNTR